MRLFTRVTVLATLACAGGGGDKSGLDSADTGTPDADADGYTVTDGDCDDADPLVFPGSVAESTADGRCMRDVDQDGFGDAAARAPFDAGTDCDDARGSVYPGSVREGAAARLCMEDDDGDGFGASAPRAGLAARGTDCNDHLRAVSPGAEEPARANGFDDDCDGRTDEVERQWLPRGSLPAARVSALLQTTEPGIVTVTGGFDLDGDGTDDDGAYLTAAGDVTSWADDIRHLVNVTDAAVPVGTGGGARAVQGVPSADGRADTLWVGAPGRGGVTVYAWAYTDFEARATLTSSTLPDGVGAEISLAGDPDGDGGLDVLVSALAEPGTATVGRVYAVAAPSVTSGTLEGMARATLLGPDPDDGAGAATDGGHDVDGDGFDDVVVGAPRSDRGAVNAGAVYLQLGGAALSGTLTLGTESGTASVGTPPGGAAGTSVALPGDIDGDGYADTVVGAPGTAEMPGTVYILRGPRWPTSLAGAASVVTGAAGDRFGAAVSGMGDMDDDGTADVAVTAPGERPGGSAYLYYGLPGPTVSKTSADATLLGDAAYAIGAALAPLGDVDDDGADDLAVGLADYGVLVVHASLRSWNLAAAADVRLSVAGTAGSSLYNNESLGYQGAAVDLDQNGALEVAAGAQGGATSLDCRAAGCAGNGAVYVWEAPRVDATTADAVSLVAGTSPMIRSLDLGVAVTAGDVTGDGWDDLLVASRGNGASNRGGIYIVAAGASLPADDTSLAGATLAWNSTEPWWPALAPLDDQDADGRDEVVIGDRQAATDRGVVQIVRGGTSFTLRSTFAGAHPGDRAGYAVATGDLDGDGLDDLAISAPYEGSVGVAAGAVYVFYSPLPTGTVDLEDAPVILRGEDSIGYFGHGLAILDDTDGDGLADLAIGAPGLRTAYVVPGLLPPGDHDAGDVATAVLREDSWSGADPGINEFGDTVAAAGDVNGDGLGDLVVTSNHDGSDSASHALFVTPFDRTVPLWFNPGPSVLDRDTSAVSGLQANSWVAGGRDLNGDRDADLLLGASERHGLNAFNGAVLLLGTRQFRYWPGVEQCEDSRDNDADGALDCEDPECALDTACLPATETACSDGQDEDADGPWDCDDPDCAASRACSGSERACEDGRDDDADGGIDCLDVDCASTTSCASAAADALLEGRSASGTTAGAANTLSSNCGGRDGPEVTYLWIAPTAGTWTFDLSGSSYDTVLALTTPAGAEIACDDDSGEGSVSVLATSLRAGQAVVVVLDSFTASGGAYELSIREGAP